MSASNEIKLQRDPIIVAAVISVLGVLISAVISGVVGIATASFTTGKLVAEQTREAAASATKAEAENEQARRPRLQVTPEIRQTSSVQDIREIRFELLLANKGSGDAVVHSVSASVEDGTAKGDAAKRIVDTQNYYYERVEFANAEARENAIQRNPILPPVNVFPAQPATHNEDVKDKISQPEPQVLFKVGDVPAPQPPALDPTRGLSKHFSKLLPPHDNCPHGTMIALSATSPDMTWEPIANAKQSINTPCILRPTQSATRHFNFLLTELPLQHNYHWYRFRIAVEYSSDHDPNKHETQEFECMVSALPPSSDPQFTVCSMTSADGSDEDLAPRKPSSVWRPSAPLMPVTTTEQ